MNQANLDLNVALLPQLCCQRWKSRQASQLLFSGLFCQCRNNQGLEAIALEVEKLEKKLSYSCRLASLLCHLGNDERKGAVLLSQLFILLSQSTQGGHLTQIVVSISDKYNFQTEQARKTRLV